MNFFKRKKLLKKLNLLEMIPVRLHQSTVEENGKVVLIIPKFKNEAFARWFIPHRKSISFKIRLDETGSALWLLIDGNNNVFQICEQMEISLNKMNKPSDHIETRVAKFLGQLYRQGYITYKELK